MAFDFWVLVHGEMGSKVASGDILGCEYVEFELENAEAISSWQGLPEAGLPPQVLPDDLVIRVGSDI